MISKGKFLTTLKNRVSFASDQHGESLYESTSSIKETLLLGKCVIVKVSGGLCNQMMCYKAGRVVSEWNRASLMLYAPQINLDDQRTFFLERYPIKYSMIFSSDMTLSKMLDSNDVLQVKKEHLFDPNGERFEGDRKQAILSRIKNAKVVYMDFWLPLYFWRADKEFSPQEDILNELTLNTKVYLSERDHEVMLQIKRCRNPVAVHIRRGDFLSTKYDLEVRVEYYLRALDFLSRRIRGPEFFIFSDDQDWCKCELKSKHKLNFIDHNDDRACTSDMYLASLCDHFILTNHSTFSHHMVELNCPKPGRLVVTNSKDFLITQGEIADYYTPEYCIVIEADSER